MVPSVEKGNLNEETISRRGFLALLGMLALSLAGCGGKEVSGTTSSLYKKESLEKANELKEQMTKLVRRYIETEDIPQIGSFRRMVKETPQNVSLDLPANKAFINYLRGLYGAGKRADLLALIISVLNVADETNQRYHKNEACNTYALDFLRLYIVSQGACGGSLTPDCIGDYYNLVSFYGSQKGVAMSFTEQDIKRIGWNTILHGEKVRIISSNNMDWWLERYGGRYGWKRVITRSELLEELAKGNIGVAVTSSGTIENERKKGRTPTGHMMVLFNPTQDPSFILRSQDTHPVLFDFLFPTSDELSQLNDTAKESLDLYRKDGVLGKGDYNYWVLVVNK